VTQFNALPPDFKKWRSAPIAFKVEWIILAKGMQSNAEELSS
jgi:hypothetical protein